MTRRIVVHAGFHQSGGAAAQRVLHANGPLLWPVLALGLAPQLQPVLSAARGFAAWRDPVSLRRVQERAGTYLSTLGLGQRDLLISAEEMCGQLPGRGDILDYSAAPVLLATVETVLRRAYPEAEVTFALVTQPRAAWIRSAHWELVKASRMTLERDAFAERLSGLDLQATAEAIRDALQGPLKCYALADIASAPFGPATALLEEMRLDEDLFAALVPPKAPPPLEEPQEDLLAELLALNRSRIAPAALKAAKAAALERI